MSHITQIDNDTYMRYGLTRRPTKNEGNETRVVHLVVDSTERDRAAFPLPNNYEVRLPADLYNVTVVKLLSSCVPFAGYDITSTNNKFNFRMIGDTTKTVKVAPGDYPNPEELAEVIEQSMNEQASIDIFQVEYSERTDNFVFHSTRPFQLDFTDANSLCQVLGFQQNTTYDSYPNGTSQYYIPSIYRRNPRNPLNKTAILHIDTMNLNVSSSDTIHGSFAILEDNGENGTVFHDENAFCQYHWPPLGRMSKVRVRLMDLEGNLFDCQNRENRFELLIEAASRQRN
jgi:hypothetical protein